jgi:hypothetical protein
MAKAKSDPTRKTRRDVMRGGALVLAAAGVAAVPAIAAGEDAALLRLWEEWKAQHLRCRDAYNAVQEVESKVWEEGGPVWELAKLDVSGPNHYRALFVSSWHGDDRVKAVPFKAKDYRLAQQRADEARVTLLRERESCRKVAERKHKYAAAKRGDDLAHRRLKEIEDQIAETPAAGLTGIAVKLALWRVWHYDEASDEVHDLLLSTYEAAVNLTGGVDLAAQVERW